MSKENGLTKIPLPTLQELHHDAELAFKNDALNLLLNQNPPQSWVKKHPYVNIDVYDAQGNKTKQALEYIPVDKTKFLLTRIFQEWHTEIVEYKALFNSVAVQIRLKVKNPITGEFIVHDGVAAVDVQTKAGASPADLSQINANAVMKALPAAASYALKNAAEKLGGIFGGNLQKNDIAAFVGSYSDRPAIPEHEDLQYLYEMKKAALSKEHQQDAERILNNKEVNSYLKLYNQLQAA